MLDESDPLAQLMRIDDPVMRLRQMVARHLVIPADRAAVVVGEGVARAKPHLRRGLAIATYFAVRERTDIPATTIELLAHEVQPVVAACVKEERFVSPQNARLTADVGACVADVNRRFGEDSVFARYHANLLNAALPDGFADAGEVRQASSDFETLWKEFGL